MIHIDIDEYVLKTYRQLLILLFPPKCLFCRSILSRNEEKAHFGICNGCEKGNPVVGWLSGNTRLGPGQAQVEGVFSGCVYTEAVKSAVIRFKFFDRTYAAKPLSYLISRDLKRYVDLFDVIVPVPLSEIRLKERGFNQSQIIAEHLGETLGCEVDIKTLIRVRHTKKQSLTGGVERQHNVYGAFEMLKENSLRGKSVLLVDDVLTTGSTVSECAKILRQNGVTTIYVAVVATAM